MTDDDYKRKLMQELTLQKFKEFNTTILIGKAAKLTKQMLRNGYRTITTAEEVRAFLDFYSTPTDTPIIFEDLSKMTPAVQAFLLKFIEEPPAPLVILASKDNISPVILSRCKRCIKFPENIKYGSKSLKEFTELKIKAHEEYIKWESNKETGKSEPVPPDILRLVDPNKLPKTSLQDCPYYWYVKSGVTTNISHLDKFIGLL